MPRRSRYSDSSDNVEKRTEQSVPVNIEKVLLDAARDNSFLKELISDPESAIRKHGYKLTESEFKILLSMPKETIENTVSRLTPELIKRSRFAKNAKIALGVTAGTAAVTVIVAPVFITLGQTREVPSNFEESDPMAEVDGSGKIDGGVENKKKNQEAQNAAWDKPMSEVLANRKLDRM